ncbi:MAG TPA: patatin-like phospholipase family protein [Reyranellaceae bacterium]|nr:patatin-like phospholipase family protein [Reyranellaceae bacterium]
MSTEADRKRERLRNALRRAPIFSDLDAEAMATVERELTPFQFQAGAALFREGDPADALYIVASGCLGVFRHDPESPEPILVADIPAGEIAGEMSLLQHSKRTRTVAALRDSEVWRLNQADFDRLTTAHPQTLATLTRKVAARNAFSKPRRGAQPRTFAVLPTGPHVSAARFTVSLATALGGMNQFVQILGPESLDESPDWFAQCETNSAYVVYRADPTATAWTELCLRQADCLIVLRNGDDDHPTDLPFALETAATGGVFHRRRELVLLHELRDPKPGSTAAKIADGAYGPHHHVRLDVPADLERLARLLTGQAVGVVMAGGGARGFAHVGAVKALRAAGVPIDLVGGASMGAIMAAGVAARWTDGELVERLRPAFLKTNPLSDYTVPAVSLFAGRRVAQLLRLAFGELDIEDLPLSFFCVTANLTAATSDLHTRGKLWRWLRATVSLPGVLPPFIDAGQVHVDGGIMDNFPIRQMRKLRRGATIGIDIDTAGTLAAGADVAEPWSAWEFFSRMMWRRKETLPIPSIVRILLRSALVSSAARAIEDRAAADLLIVPPVSHFDLLDWTSFDEAVEIGYRSTMEALDKAKTLPIAQRIYLA